MRSLKYLVPGLILSAALGCSAGGDKAFQPVTGQVIVDGKPAEGVSVHFMSADGGGRQDEPNPHAVTGPDGTFSLTTFEDGDGAREGKYRVLLRWTDPNSELESPPDRLFGWYNWKNTKLVVKVQAGTNALPPFKLPLITGPPPPTEGIPGRN